MGRLQTLDDFRDHAALAAARRGLRTACLALLLGILGAWTATPARAQDDIRAEIVPPTAVTDVRLQRRIPRAAQWDVTVEGAFTLFEDPDGILGEAVPPATPTLDFGRNTYDGQIGARLTVGRRASTQTRWQLRGSWQGGFDDTSRQTGRFGFRPAPGGAVALSPTASADIHNDTDIWSVELNWWRRVRCNPCAQLDLGIGARVIGIDDQASATNWVGLAPNAFLEAQVNNRFLGLQAMAQWTQRVTPRFEIGLTGKALLGAMNRDMTETDVSIVTGGVTTNGKREETDFGWGFELEVSALWRVMARVGITASYSMLYLSDITRAEQAIDLSQAATGSVQLRDRSDSTLLHSFFLGVRIDI